MISKPKSHSHVERYDPTEIITRIAAEELGLETLEIRGKDRLDFHDLPVSGIKRALTRAFTEGCATAALQQGETNNG